MSRYLCDAFDAAESLIAMKNKEAEKCRAPETFEVRSTNLYPRLCIGVWAGTAVVGGLVYAVSRATPEAPDGVFVAWLFWGLGLILLIIGLWMRFQHFVVTPEGVQRKFGRFTRWTYPWEIVTEARLVKKNHVLALYHGGRILFGVSPEMKGYYWLLQTVKRRRIPVKRVKKIPWMDYIRA